MANYVLQVLTLKRPRLFQSERSLVQKLGFQLGKRTNLSELKLYTDLMVRLILLTFKHHWCKPVTFFREYGGLRPIVVPVGSTKTHILD